VVHLAAFLQFACERDPAQAIRVNVDGTLNVLEACRHANIGRVVFGSSIAAYGERADLMREDDPPTARLGLYGMTKLLGEMLGKRYAALTRCSSGLATRGVRPGRQRRRRWCASASECALGDDVPIEDASGDERAPDARE
jgi:nucleoside-diphosphate-sugar epimerase